MCLSVSQCTVCCGMTLCAYSVHGLVERCSVLQCVLVCCPVKKKTSQNVWARINSVINELRVEFLLKTDSGYPKDMWVNKP